MRTPGTCVNCKRVRPIHAKGRCDACYFYRRVHGQERPPEGAIVPLKPCTECGVVLPLGKRRRGLCEACYKRQERRGLVSLPPKLRPARVDPPPPPFIPLPVRRAPPMLSAPCQRCGTGRLLYDGDVPMEPRTLYTCYLCGEHRWVGMVI